MDGFVLGESVSSSEAAEAAVFAVMSPVIVGMSDEEFEDDPSVSPVLFAVSRSMWECALVNARGWREFVVAAGACGCQRRRVEVATVAARELLRGGRVVS